MGQPFLTWRHVDDGGLVLDLGHRAAPVPEPVIGWLTGPDGLGTTADPGADVIRLEARIRAWIADQHSQLGHAELRVAAARASAKVIASPWWSWSARTRWRANSDEVAAALEVHNTVSAEYKKLLGVQEILRQYVIELQAPSGLLAEAAAGWQRSPEAPASVTIIDTEDAFLAADSRRAASPEWSGVLGGSLLGQCWRRDGDDDPHDRPLHRNGTWAVGHIRGTGEIYASRRGSRVPPQVWLLGTGFDTDTARDLIADVLLPRMREPNSVVLVADAVAAARFPPPDSGAAGDVRLLSARMSSQAAGHRADGSHSATG